LPAIFDAGVRDVAFRRRRSVTAAIPEADEDPDLGRTPSGL
jgi:hypothetical protein